MNQDLAKKDLSDNEVYNVVLGLKDHYTPYTKLFVDFLKKTGKRIDSIEALKAYSTFLHEDRNGYRYNANSYNLYLSAAKNRMRILFGNTKSGLDITKRFIFEKRLSEIKLKKTKKKVDDYISTEEYKKLIAGTEDELMKLMIEIMFTHGIRISEMLGILLTDIKEMEKYYKIRINGRGNKERSIKVKKDLIDRINRYYNNPHRIYLFETNKYGTRLTRNNVAMQIKRLGKKILGRDIHPHLFRHGFCVEKIKAGKSIKAISRYVGHSSSSITVDLYEHDELEPYDLEIL